MKVTVEEGQGSKSKSMSPKTFRSGSTGFWTQFKVDAGDGRRYQVQVQAVLIGSKPQDSTGDLAIVFHNTNA